MEVNLLNGRVGKRYSLHKLKNFKMYKALRHSVFRLPQSQLLHTISAFEIFGDDFSMDSLLNALRYITPTK